jgi:hypothetical protein
MEVRFYTVLSTYQAGSLQHAPAESLMKKAGRAMSAMKVQSPQKSDDVTGVCSLPAIGILGLDSPGGSELLREVHSWPAFEQDAVTNLGIRLRPCYCLHWVILSLALAVAARVLISSRRPIWTPALI